MCYTNKLLTILSYMIQGAKFPSAKKKKKKKKKKEGMKKKKREIKKKSPFLNKISSRL